MKNEWNYLLFGKDESNNDLVYIGEAEILFERLRIKLAHMVHGLKRGKKVAEEIYSLSRGGTP